jgi:uncharacterized protein YjbI with pentapeptide repeats
MGREFFPRASEGEGFFECHIAQGLLWEIGTEMRSVLQHGFDAVDLCWNDFIDVDFSHAVLAACDLRSSLFERVKFVGADLRAADLRRSSFEACTFVDANMQGAILTRGQDAQISLSRQQRIAINWRDDEGPEPDSG